MLKSELKDIIKDYDKKELEKIIVELYKRIPKAKKMDYDIDFFIKNVGNKVKPQKKEINFEELEDEILDFISDVDAGFYASPNRQISKIERSKWRFKVKRYYKELIKISPDNENGSSATELLIKLFTRLSTGTSSLLFASWSTFEALGVAQSDYYDLIIKRLIYNGYTRENLKQCVSLFDVDKSPNEYSDSMFYVYISNLKTTDTKEMSIELINEKIESLRERLQKVKNNYNIAYYIKESINNSITCISDIYFSLNEIDEGIKYYKKNYIESDKEVKQYVLLEKLEEHDLKEVWIKEYEDNLKTINYRNYLKEKYNELKASIK